MDESPVNMNWIEELLPSIGLNGWSTEIAPYGRNSLTIFLRPSPEQPIRYAIQIPTPNAAYQIAKKARIYNLVGEHSSIPVPQASLQLSNNRPYLIMSYCAGKPLSDCFLTDDKTCQILFLNIGAIIAELHAKIPAGNSFGWIDQQGIPKPFKKCSDYIGSEAIRIREVLAEQLDASTLHWLEKSIWPQITLLYQLESSPTFVWYDIHSDNILVQDDTKDLIITGWLDPGAARIGAPEWDLAHACEHLCQTTLEEDCLLDSYASHTGRKTDSHILNAFRALIVLDDLALSLTGQWKQLTERCLQRLKHLD